MGRTRSSQSANLDRFMRSIARVLGVPRKKLDRLMFPGFFQSEEQVRSSVRRRKSTPEAASK